MASLPVGSRRRALLSVTDKTGIVELGTLLAGHGYELVASGGTAAALRQADVPVTSVSDLTGYPEVFGGRVKTLHPVIHGGILGPTAASFTETAALGIAPIDVVVVNLYRFADAVASGASDPEIVEKIDIGGPTLLRAAAKNFARVTVLSDPDDYAAFAAQLADNDGATTVDFRREMAALTFARVERYDSAIADWFSGDADWATITLRYGENPHQNGALELRPARRRTRRPGPRTAWRQGTLVQQSCRSGGGREVERGFRRTLLRHPQAHQPLRLRAGRRHAGTRARPQVRPGVGLRGRLRFNHTVDEETAAILAKRFLEIIIAPSFAPAALAKLTRKKNVRVLTVDQERFLAATRTRSRTWGALTLVQDEDEGFPELDSWQVVAGDEPDAATRTALEMVWKVCKHGKSNAIVLGDLTATLGLGFGQMSRVDSTELAVMKAGNQGLDLTGCVAASDGFFPFPDGVQKLAAAGCGPSSLRADRSATTRWRRPPGTGGHPDPDRAASFQSLSAPIFLY